MILTIYFIGFLVVWIADKRMTDDSGWYSVTQRLAVSLFSWVVLLMFIVIQLCLLLGEALEDSGIKPNRWL